MGDAIEIAQRDQFPTAARHVTTARLSASTFREDPLPDRKINNRGVSLPTVKWLERPDP